MSAEEVAQAFVGHYYQAFDNDANQLASLFVRFQFHPQQSIHHESYLQSNTYFILFFYRPTKAWWPSKAPNSKAPKPFAKNSRASDKSSTKSNPPMSSLPTIPMPFSFLSREEFPLEETIPSIFAKCFNWSRRGRGRSTYWIGRKRWNEKTMKRNAFYRGYSQLFFLFLSFLLAATCTTVSFDSTMDSRTNEWKNTIHTHNTTTINPLLQQHSQQFPCRSSNEFDFEWIWFDWIHHDVLSVNWFQHIFTKNLQQIIMQYGQRVKQIHSCRKKKQQQQQQQASISSASSSGSSRDVRRLRRPWAPPLSVRSFVRSCDSLILSFVHHPERIHLPHVLRPTNAGQIQFFF